MKYYHLINLFFTLCVANIIMFCSVGCNNNQVKDDSKYQERPVQIGGMKTDELMPPEATKIKYKFDDSGFGCTIDWQCSIKQKDFLSFAKRKHWKLLDKKPMGVNICFYYRGTFDFPANYYYYFAPTASSAGLYILYDKGTEILDGHYADR